MLAAVLAFGLSLPALAGTARITLDVHDAQIANVIALLAAQSGANVVADDSVKPDKVTLHLRNVTFEDALSVLVASHDLQVRRQNGVFIVGASDAMNRRYGDLNDERGSRTVVLNLTHGVADDVAKALTAALPDGTVVVPDKRTGSVIISGSAQTVRRARVLAAALDSPEYGASEGHVAQVYPLKYVKASEVAANLKGVLTDGSFVADDAQNAIVVSGNAETQHTAQRFVRSINVPSPQVLFEVRVADLQPINEQSNVGIQFGGYDFTGKPIPGAATYAFTRNSLAINATLNALVSEGHAQISLRRSWLR